jgi:hypothetical protein
VLTAIIIAALGIIATLTGALVYVLVMLRTAHHDADAAYKSLGEETKMGFDFQQQIAVLKAANADFEKAQTAIGQELSRELKARQLAEKQRDHMLEELAKGGDPRAVGDLINKELAALAEMGKQRT